MTNVYDYYYGKFMTRDHNSFKSKDLNEKFTSISFLSAFL